MPLIARTRVKAMRRRSDTSRLSGGGFLPATADSVARYLAEHAATLSINTLKHRLSAIARWHADHGFPDPTRSPVVRKVLRGIRSIHSAPDKQARPLELLQLQQVSNWLAQESPKSAGENPERARLRQARDQAMLLIGFWRGFRADELTRLTAENITVEPGKSMICYLPRSKGDRESSGRSFLCPVLSRLCPVTAYENWLAVSGLTSGPVFRSIDRWGHLGTDAIAPGSVIPWLRRLFHAAGVEAPLSYSSHSLRRGFAGWARASGWDLKELMAYVGWKDVKSAMRYLDLSAEDLSARFEQGLAAPDSLPSPDEESASSSADTRPRTTNQKPSLKIVK